MSKLWFFGESGSRRVSELATTLHEQYLQLAIEQVAVKSPRYLPWMSCQMLIHEFSAFDLAPSDRIDIVTSPDALTALNSCLYLNDLQPFAAARPNFNPFRIARPDSGSLNRFKAKVSASLKLLNSASYFFRNSVENLVVQIVPLEAIAEDQPLREMGCGMSVHWYLGGIFLGLPIPFQHDTLELSINLSHEIGHQAFMIYQNADPILTDDSKSTAYSAVRKTERPAILAVHAVVAISFMVEFLRTLDIKKLSESDNEYRKTRLRTLEADYRDGLQAVSGLTFTPFGNSLITDMENHLENV